MGKTYEIKHGHEVGKVMPIDLMFICTMCGNEIGIVLSIKCPDCGDTLCFCNDCAEKLGLTIVVIG